MKVPTLSAMKLNLNMPAFVPKPLDPVGDNLKVMGITEEEDIKKIKDVLAELKKEGLTQDLFKAIAETKLCDTTDENLKGCVNVSLMKREVKE